MSDIPNLRLLQAMASCKAGLINVIVKAEEMHGLEYAERVEELGKHLLNEFDTYRDRCYGEETDEK